MVADTIPRKSYGVVAHNPTRMSVDVSVPVEVGPRAVGRIEALMVAKPASLLPACSAGATPGALTFPLGRARPRGSTFR